MEPKEERLRTPRAAGLAGTVFALLLAAAIVLVRIAIPTGNAADETVAPNEQWAVRTALEILPFTGIFFLWFMGALRARVGDAEDRFVATVFLGSGLVFVATMFGAGAAAGSVLSQPSAFGRHFAYTMMTTYALRMAAVFVFTASTIGHRLGALPRPLALFGYLVGLVLLVAGSSLPWSELVFPAWALVVSLHLLRVGLRAPASG
ncbi:hypothetical protein OOK58_10440 [Streptomyces sp. NBC_01728]|uniref:hypothetical protein n=1 Tax=unclassified Streptomyces TaxID=2593676 RepID=UPI002258EF33|nr:MULTISPECIES: hypothetical protein [unclassified Streptomyces]MCX4452517.1 hypothetical protein [Streptomyces sp. NBC_01719]MCX4491877.1 hypothetical protein [Streptomyces sp. NBC_01728]MCX4593623.1 hypothetical protein [Streptomyces sp. NBC_01549]